VKQKREHFFKRNSSIIWSAVSLGGLLFLLRWLELRVLFVHHAMELYVGAIALIFTGLGIWLALRLVQRKTVIVEKEIAVEPDFSLNEEAVRETGISRRELEVLALMADGLSNQEIADKLFVSLNTVKTHSSRLFEKLGVKRRTQAVERGKSLRIIP
jgi:DNA-binding NarL/FixJ family response regulator